MVKMKVLDYERLMMLNESSIHAGRKQYLKPEQVPDGTRQEYTVNFHFDHEYSGQRDVRLSVIVKPGQTAWLDVSAEEFAAIPETAVSELEWEAAVCVGTPRWTA